MNIRWKTLSALALALGLGCASTAPPAKEYPLPTKGRPEWIDRGSGFYDGARGKAFYGVGAASNISIVSLRRSTSEAQARADLARTFRSNVANLVKSYTLSTLAGATSSEITEQFARETTKAFTTLELTGVPVVDHYYDENEQTQYSLAMMDAATFKGLAAQMSELNRQMREAVEKNAEKAFEEMEQEKTRAQQGR